MDEFDIICKTLPERFEKFIAEYPNADTYEIVRHFYLEGFVDGEKHLNKVLKEQLEKENNLPRYYGD